MDDPRNNDTHDGYFRWVTLVTTLLALYFLFMRHKVKFEWLKNFASKKNATHIFYEYAEILAGDDQTYQIGKTTPFTTEFFMEFLVMMVCPIPYCDGYVTVYGRENKEVTYLVSELIFAFMFLRLYFVFRAIFNYSIYNDAYSKKLMKYYEVTEGVHWTIVAEMNGAK